MGNVEQLKTEDEYRKRLVKRAEQLIEEKHQKAGDLINSFLIIKPFNFELADWFYRSEYLEYFSDESLEVCSFFMFQCAEVEWYRLLGMVYDEKTEVQQYHDVIRECYEKSMDPLELQEILAGCRSIQEFKNFIMKKGELKQQIDNEKSDLISEDVKLQKELLQFMREENSYLHDLVAQHLKKEKNLRNKIHTLFEENMSMKKELFQFKTYIFENEVKSKNSDYRDRQRSTSIITKEEPQQIIGKEDVNDQKTVDVQFGERETATEHEEYSVQEFNNKTQVEQENLIKIAMLEHGMPKENVKMVNRILMDDAADISNYDLFQLIRKKPSEDELRQFCGIS